MFSGLKSSQTCLLLPHLFLSPPPVSLLLFLPPDAVILITSVILNHILCKCTYLCFGLFHTEGGT